MKVYIVTWACGSVDDHDVVHTNSGIHELYVSKESAKIGLEEFKQTLLEELKEFADPDGDMPELLDEINLTVEGSVDEEYFRIEYTLGCEPVNELLKIEEKELIG